MAKQRKRRSYCPEALYKACKFWAAEEAKCFGEPNNLAQVWRRAVRDPIYRKHVFWEYELGTEYGEV